MIKGKVNGTVVFSLAEAIELVMQDEINRQPKEIMAELVLNGICPSRRTLHYTIEKMVKKGALKRAKFGKYEYVPVPLTEEIVKNRIPSSAIELQMLHENREKPPPTVAERNKSYLDKLLEEGKMFVNGQGKPLRLKKKDDA